MQEQERRERPPPLPLAAKVDAAAAATARRQSARLRRRPSQGGSSPPPQAGRTARATRPRASRARRSRSPPRAPKQRAKTPVDRSNTRPSARSTELKAWIARVHDAGHFAIEAKANSIDPMQAEISRHRAGAGAQRRLLHPARPQAVRRRRRPVRRRPCARPDQGERRARGAAAAAGIRRHPEDRLQHQVQRRDAGAARHHACATTTMRS